MSFIVENWQALVGIGAVIAVAAILIYNFFKQPKSKQLQKVQEWLLWAVIQAERTLGSGTGILKLRFVYDMFLGRFPAIARFITFEKFSELVDKALDKMREILSQNKQLEAYVEE